MLVNGQEEHTRTWRPFLHDCGHKRFQTFGGLLGIQETWYWPGQVGADAVVMSGVRCSGTEMSLSHCLHHGAHLNCPKGGGQHAAGVSCSESKSSCHVTMATAEGSADCELPDI